MTAALETSGLGKSYGRGARAVSALGALDLSIPRGMVYGVLGPNGAGKSTLLRLALGLIRPSRGSVRLLVENRIDARVLRRVGAMIEAPALYPFLTARETMQAFARYSGLKDPAREQAVLDRVGLTAAADRRVGTYSGGMRRRLDLALSLIHQPTVLFLDEPTTGLDPMSRLSLWEEVRRLNNEGTTIVMVTHSAHDANYAHRIINLFDGKVVTENIREQFHA